MRVALVRADLDLRQVSGLVAAAMFLAACAGIKSQTNSYATLTEARASGAIAKGWIPEGLPTGSHDIREGHVPGASQRWGLFEYPQAEEATLRAMLEPQEIAADGLPCDVPARIEWWPPVLRGPLDGSRVAATGARLYHAKSGGFMFAVNWNQGRAYYWRE
jgi:hypothetical protein